MEETRIYGKKVKISEEKEKDFWESRIGANNGTVMLSDKTVGDKRNENEKNLLLSLIDGGIYAILDIGCGLGRWVDNFGKQLALYDGCDFSKSFIDAASEKYRCLKNVRFYNMPATEVNIKRFPPVYNLVIINGLCVNMNDDAVNLTLKNVYGFIEAGAKLYFRESVSVIGERLTLNDFPSEELGVPYSAVYRTPEEYEQVFNNNFSNFAIKTKGLLHAKTSGDDTWKRTETNQHYWLITCRLTV